MGKIYLIFFTSLLILQIISKECQGFDQFVAKYQKEYRNDQERQYRKGVFCQRLKTIQQKNQLNPQAKYEINQFTDRSQDQVLHPGIQNALFTSEKFITRENGIFETNSNSINVSDSQNWTRTYKNWVKEGKVTRVKNQANCGSCTAFAAAACGQSRILIRGQFNIHIDLSEQQILDCTSTTCSNGGYTQVTMQYLRSGGIATEIYYPYVGRDNSDAKICNLWNRQQGVSVTKHVFNYYNLTEIQIMKLLQQGPVAINIAAQDWLNYKSGILKCYRIRIDHAALLVGYGTDNGTDYWLIKNSWGRYWGEQGFIRVMRDAQQFHNCMVGNTVIALYELTILFKAILLVLLALSLH